MASSSAPLNEELQCSICLDVFTDPVTTPCGHNFCRTCLNKCWTNMKNCFCPFCKETFNKKPDLKINTTLREVVQHFKEKLSLEEPEVFCDICEDRKQKAVKSCLMCESSYCETHLEPHLRVPRLQKHKLINAVGNLEDYICEKHQRPVELFCRDDQTCVCLSCTEGEHRNHNTVPVEQESQHKKCQLVKAQADALYAIQYRMKKIEDIKHSVEMRKVNTEKEKSASVDLFTDLIRSIERCQSETLKMMEEEQKAAEKQAEDLIKKLKQEITELKRRNTELEQISRSQDHLHLIQIYPSLCSPLIKKTWTKVGIDSDVNVHTLTEALTQLKGTLDGKLRKNVMTRIGLLGVIVIPDNDTVNPHLSLPDYGQGIEYCGSKIKYKNHPKRFDQYPCVLGETGFSSGRFYLELLLRGNRRWDFGVARESVNRKGPIKLSPRNGFWTVSQKDDSGWYYAGQDQEVCLYQKVKPDTVGVLVDYDEGLVSFYNVDSCTLMYSFTGQTFTEKLYPFFGHKGNTIMYINDSYTSYNYN